MSLLRFALAAALCFAAPVADAAGLTFIQIPADAVGPAMDAALWSPCAKSPEKMKIGSLTLPAVPDCPIKGEKLPLIVISHGYGGWYLGHHDTAEALADAGFMVIAINHPHANHFDMSRGNGLGVLVERPLDIKRTVDYMLMDFPETAKIDPNAVGFYGFSQGGYTGLVVAGANPDFNALPPRCADPKALGCPPAMKMQLHRPKLAIPSLVHDVRIRAMVVADPLSVVFPTADSVKDVTIPLQLWGSELGGGGGASPENVAALARELPRKPDFHVVKNAVHLSFLTPCPPIDHVSQACVDAPGFDRAEFHRMFNADVVVFFREHLMAAK
ncbi:dienelactone hydrolase [Allorhizobium sp. BGMRC 0089]|uniref:alpha/beta hydrolase family protein n=1 Tax=Allorhizobium sonneratiae TaxID=2934936 RepID=UPI002033A329|nr:dienelactone hydrolase [Allorhizobium sonneratiae]MCM2292824.1 dienelactone hydrolase [Allorhizobium sonneratiae]